MPATKVVSTWVTGNLTFKEVVDGNGGQVIFGHTNGGLDVVFRGTTSSYYSMWDESANGWVNDGVDFKLNDNDYLKLGDSTDASLCWDSAKLALTAATASTFQLGSSGTNINTRFVGTLIVGTTGKSTGKDVTFYGTTAANLLLWDASENAMILDGCDIVLKDSDYIKFGDAPDINLCWDAAKLALTAAAASTFQVGSSSNKINTRFVGTIINGSTGKNAGSDVTLYGTTTVNYAKWGSTTNELLLDGSDVHLNDNDYLKLGDSTDASLCWDAAKIALTAATASTFQLGSSGTNINTRMVGTLIVGTTGKSAGKDVTFYGTTAANYMKWGSTSIELLVEGGDIHLNDSDYLKLGDSTDASLCWDSAKIALTAATGSTFQLGTSTANVNTRFVGTLIVGTTGKNVGKDVTIYGTTTTNAIKFTAASNRLQLDGIALTGTSTASEALSIQAWGTAASTVIQVKNSTGNAAVKLGFFGATPIIRQAHIADATTLSNVLTGFNTLLGYLENFGLLLTS